MHRLSLNIAVSNDPGSPLAQRHYSEPPHPYRTPYQRDRARVIHSRAFRRLAGKTQVFTHRYSDHFRSRLTHTMEVAQISRTVAATLGLNEDLAEALALAHDLGHPPFGHAGEQALDRLLRPHGLRFDHNLHALRVVTHFEQHYAAFRGLNLTFALREGIVKHSRDYPAAEHPELALYLLDSRPPLEAQIIDLADEIAYTIADLDDGVDSGVLEIPHVSGGIRLFKQHYRQARRQYSTAPSRMVLNETLKQMLNAMVGDLIAETARRVKSANIHDLAELRNRPERLAAFTPVMAADLKEAKRYLHANLYGSPELNRDHDEANRIICDLFTAWTTGPALLPAEYQANIAAEGAPRVVADYVAGMTDNFILERHREWRETAS